jgi:outer membrane receptor for monomeric catechols
MHDVRPGPFTIEDINVGKTRSEGVELLAESEITRSVALNFAYTHTDAVIVSNPEDPSQEGQPAGGVPKNRVNLDLTSHLAGGTTLGLRGRYLSRQIDEFSGGFLDAHAVFDASLSHPIAAGLELFMLGENLFNRKYVANNFGGTQLGAPRQWFGGVRWTVR